MSTPSTPPPLDPVSLSRIEKLHPKLRAEAKVILSEIQERLTGRAICRFVYTLRTMSEQRALYALGRTVKNPDGLCKTRPYGNQVTNAKEGTSYHNYGMAIDIALVIDGKTASWDTERDFDGDKQSDWMECVAVFEKHGWEWGGRWHSFKDMPHFQKTFGHHWPELIHLRNVGKVDKEGYVII